MRIAIICLALALLIGPASASFQFEEPTARNAGFGGAAVGLPADAAAPAVNPAALAGWTGYGAVFNYAQPYDPSFMDFDFGGAFQLPVAGSVGFSWQGFGTFLNGNMLTAENRITLAHGFWLRSDQSMSFGLGYGFSLHTESFAKSKTGIDPGSAMALGINLGAYARIWDRINVGLAVNNVNYPSIGKDQTYELGRMLAFGMSYDPYDMITTSFQVDKTMGTDVRYRMGLEARPHPIVAIRVGLSTEPVRFTTGLGLTWQGILIDYAYKYHSYLGPTHLLTVGYRFDPTFGGSARP